MPLYEYECSACHKRTEKIQKFSDPEITECPHCGGELNRVISAPAIAFKGGGWYADLYSSSKPKSESKSAENAGSSEAVSSPSASSAESSPAAAAPAPATAAATAKS